MVESAVVLTNIRVRIGKILVNPSTPTCRSIPAGLVRFISSTALSRLARDRLTLSSSALPKMSSSPMPLPPPPPPPKLEPPVATSPRPGIVWLMLTLLERPLPLALVLALAGKRPPVSVAESCARIFSTCQEGARVAAVSMQARGNDTRSFKRTRVDGISSPLALPQQ